MVHIALQKKHSNLTHILKLTYMSYISSNKEVCVIHGTHTSIIYTELFSYKHKATYWDAFLNKSIGMKYICVADMSLIV